ncbi:MAG: cyclase family protein, partial [Ensifer adhaerens]
MFNTAVLERVLVASLVASLVGGPAFAQEVGKSPWGPKDEIGRLNLITPESRAAILSRIEGSKSYDLAVEYFIGMPSWEAAGDPPYQMWMTHTPNGTLVSDPMKVGKEMNAHVSYTGSAVS